MNLFFNKVLKDVCSNISYKACTFYLDKDSRYSIENSHFTNCSFRGEAHFINLEGCSFSNCGFSKVIMDLSNQSLYKVPNYVFDLTFIDDLHLYENQLESISPSLKKIERLNKLVLLRNRISNFPETITKLSSLSHLNLCGNEIETIPKNISNLKNLTDLYLRWNKINKLPKEIGKLQNLRELDLEGNPITRRQQRYIRRLLPNCNIYFG
ncbi:leucine-rich repeat domain-containing protein [Candidatus Uabimicrobium sp. HlEnr_7]|uniref:leucine-rich repeat domain-containing protein n=1 Tax=Candidatus Uabimicrobium helgolandensis TaxID=3095367 RepID=UPI003557789E